MTRILPDGPQIDIHRVALERQDDFDGWRDAARGLVEAGVPPEAVIWTVEGQTDELFGSQPPPEPSGGGFSVPNAFIGLAKTVVCHRDPERFGLLYAMLWKLRRNRRAMEDRADPLLDRLRRMEKEVRRDAHKMHAFVRFREMDDGNGERMVAWFEPDNHIVRREAGFFMRRFNNMRWSILTPQLCIHWDGETLSESPGATKADAPGGDPVEETWKTYYKSIFNPARVKVKAMTAEMPKKYWKNMPETEAIGELLATAQAREAAMIETSRAQESPLFSTAPVSSWEELARLARERHGADPSNSGTQLVFGEGNRNAKLMLVGEQPGDEEDTAGRPFVGPAGQLLDDMLERAGIERSNLYVTNAVKRFKFVQRGKKRIHAKPTTGDIEHYRWWVEAERELVQPGLTLALGATAARSITGKTVTISKVRGEELALPGGGTGMVTIHPSYLLRLPDKAARTEQRARFIDDLKRAADRAAALAA